MLEWMLNGLGVFLFIFLDEFCENFIERFVCIDILSWNISFCFFLYV